MAVHSTRTARTTRREWSVPVNTNHAEFLKAYSAAVAAYLGRWLWQRVRGDVVTEYGGTVKDFDVMFPWAPYYADAVFEAAPYAHPEWEIPSDHPLAQCDGQTSLPLIAHEGDPR